MQQSQWKVTVLADCTDTKHGLRFGDLGQEQSVTHLSKPRLKG